MSSLYSPDLFTRGRVAGVSPQQAEVSLRAAFVAAQAKKAEAAEQARISRMVAARLPNCWVLVVNWAQHAGK